MSLSIDPIRLKTEIVCRVDEGGRGLGEKLVEMERRMGMQEGRKW